MTPAAEHYYFKLDFQSRAVVLVTVPTLPPVRLERFLKKLTIKFETRFWLPSKATSPGHLPQYDVHVAQ